MPQMQLLVPRKSGMGVEDVLEQLVKEIPAPEGDVDAPLQALIIDSWFDNYLGVVSSSTCYTGNTTQER